jgi:uncharacterized membrane protein
MLLHIKLFFIALLIFIVMDIMWFRLIANDFYFQHYAPWLRLVDGKFQPVWWAALLIYVLFSLSLLVFVIPLAHHALLPAALYGALLGATFYGVYNLTCIAVFKDFPIASAFVDICWGGFSYGWAAFLIQWFKLH